MLKEGQCTHAERCWFSHDPAVLAEAKRKSKTLCKYHTNGSCKKGANCEYSHAHQTEKPKGSEGLGTVALALVPHSDVAEVHDSTKPDRLTQAETESLSASGSVAETTRAAGNQEDANVTQTAIDARKWANENRCDDPEMNDLLEEIASGFELVATLEKQRAETQAWEQKLKEMHDGKHSEVEPRKQTKKERKREKKEKRNDVST